jgi:Zn-dependent protease with chaperone function
VILRARRTAATMDFFEAQARAKQRTSRLLVLFILAVLGTILAGYGAALLLMAKAGGRLVLWQPGLLAAVAAGTGLVVGLASLFKWSEFRAGGSAVAESVGGRRVDPHTTDLNERRLLNVVEEMAIASGLTMPAVYILDDEPAINAFAAGLTTSDAVVTVTRGTLEKLTRDELQGVVGHEFSHILNGDMRLNVKLTAILFGILVIGLAGRGILQTVGRGRVRVGGGGKNKGGGVAAILAVGLALMVIGYVGYFFGRLIQAAVSRQREFLADASSVQFTRNPGGLTGALKKIGGFALGSSMQSTKSTAIGHFFFAQGFQSMFGGAWATHPPLDERIRAIDPQFDGKFVEPPEVVDVAREPWGRPGRPRDAAGFAPGALSRPTPASAVQAIGTLSPASVANAQDLLAGLAPALREAARQPAAAPALVFGLLLDADPAVRARQQALIAQHAGPEAAAALAELVPALAGLQPGQKLPLLQLALPALRPRDAGQLEAFFTTLDELVHADGRVTIFEFALQKLLLRHLSLGGQPTAQVIQVYSFQAVAPEISLVLSVLARTAHPADGAEPAFAAGAAQLRLLDGRLALLPPDQCGLRQLEAALDRLATASGPIKLRLLTAAAHVVAADGTLAVTEAELLRAIAAALDVPMPPLG